MTPREWTEGDVAHIDVRSMQPPQPLVSIMRRISQLPPGAPLVAHLDRMPVMLFPELDEIRWEWERLPAPDDEVRLLLRPAP